MTGDQEPLTIQEAAAAMRARTLTPLDLFNQCLARIDRYEASVQAWVVVDRDGAREQAKRLTDELNRGQVRGPLHGIPVGIKDIIDVCDLPTGCGSRLWTDSVARQDAACVKRLRAAGAVIVGKTVTTACAYLDPAVTRNPWDPTRTPGGSSSGSAAAVACGMCVAALGTQTGGSVTRPAAFCGVASCKPTWGAVSVDGVLPLAASLDHVGVMARCVDDLKEVYRVIGNDRGDAGPARSGNSIRLGRLRGPFEERADRDLWRQLSAIGGPAIEVVEVPLPPRFAEIWLSHRALMAVEAAGVHGERLRRCPDDYPPRIRELVEDGLRLGPSAGETELARREDLRRQVTPMIESFDALLTPAATGPAPGRETTGDPIFNAPWSYLGWPTVSFPIGMSGENNLPLAVQLVSRPGNEEELFSVAAACEARFGKQIGLPPPR
jgi:aspartyl-tRNA(Asn)/glutamyl-tRNA(Gln) amidotransferase subunit A